ncbi:hypothetical protein [Geitlerinema sp. PCC 9228]|jgi:hypothetical protein|uniref:hypothetical protein n=1 Tax=Geitlerinema sp. PCC 9228 TaxID=111611 RepID=UPI0008F9AF8A|nr:hypothetical protein [Geitlerinema sp. PCC 9228]
MKELWLVLTNPYTYQKALNRALDRLRATPTSLSDSGEEVNIWVVFLIDPQTIENMVRDLCDRGWLGASSLHNLESSMLEGYRALAQDVLQEVRRQFEAASTKVETTVASGSLREYVEELVSKEERQIIISYAGAMPAWMHTYENQASFIEEG